MEVNKIHYSIIIPHKNIPHLLTRCIETIPERDDIQIIIVDDNSDPNIVDFSSFPGLNKPNTEIYFTKEGKGAGYARNIGLLSAKGKWLIFADADDYFNDCFNEAMNKYINFKADIIFFQSDSVDSDTGIKIKSRGNYYNLWLQKSIKKNKILDEVRFKINPPWAKFFYNEFINNNNIKFDEVIAANDVMFSTKCGYKAKNIKIDLSMIYCSTIRSGSLDLTHNELNISSRFNVALSHFKYLKAISKVKFHMNIFSSINMLRKLDNPTAYKKALMIAFQEMGLLNVFNDFFEVLMLKIKKTFELKYNKKSNSKIIYNE